MRLSDLIHTPHLQTLSVHLSPWASEADVLLYVDFVNALLRKHKRARLYDKYAPLKCLTDADAARMIKDRRTYLKRQLTTKESFTMEGLNADFTLKVAHLCPAVSPDIQALELQRQFVSMQWDFPRRLRADLLETGSLFVVREMRNKNCIFVDISGITA